MAAANRERGRRPPVVAAKREEKKIHEKKNPTQSNRTLESPGVKNWKDQSAIVLQERGTAAGRRRGGVRSFALSRREIRVRRGEARGATPELPLPKARLYLTLLPFLLKMQPDEDRKKILEKERKTTTEKYPQSPTKTWRSEPGRREECL